MLNPFQKKENAMEQAVNQQTINKFITGCIFSALTHLWHVGRCCNDPAPPFSIRSSLYIAKIHRLWQKVLPKNREINV
jgi:hypothetical protein